MNQHYWIVLMAFLLGQFLITSIQVYNNQKEKHISYGVALLTYLKAEIGYFIIGFIGILCVCFLLSDYIDLNVKKEELKNLEVRTWKENLQLYFRTGSFIIGCFIQYIAFKYKDKGKDAIDKAASKI